MKAKIQEQFKKLYGEGASLFASPGRVNLIGEHTDYNLGFVLPGAIDKAIYVAIKPNDGKNCRIHSIDYNESIEMDMHGEKPAQQWACYIYGVIQEMEKRGALIRPFDMVFGGDVPLGAGLSSCIGKRCGICAQYGFQSRFRSGSIGQNRTDDRTQLRGRALRNHGPICLAVR